MIPSVEFIYSVVSEELSLKRQSSTKRVVATPIIVKFHKMFYFRNLVFDIFRESHNGENGDAKLEIMALVSIKTCNSLIIECQAQQVVGNAITTILEKQ